MRAVRIASQVALVFLVTVANGCNSNASAGADISGSHEFSPAQRAVRIETTGCGFAPGRTGSGVAIGESLVLTVAHLVARADEVVASVGHGEEVKAAIIAIDLSLDLAVLRVPPDEVPAVDMARAAAGDQGLIVGGAASGTVPFEVKDVVSLSIEEILGTDRHTRLGYELEAMTTTGDSGAGAYDAENRLIGIVFATGEDGESSWITGGAEIERFLAAHEAGITPIVCDPEASRLELP